jgi:hypothetical protein
VVSSIYKEPPSGSLKKRESKSVDPGYFKDLKELSVFLKEQQ